MPRIWLDPLTPKQALFCQKIAEHFLAANFEITYTTRDYAEVIGRLELLGIQATVIGKHGGGPRYEKLLASAERVVALAKYINKIKPDIGFAFASPESARVAFGLGIPYFTANDSPHSHYVAHLTIPFAHTLFTPWIMRESWIKLGIPPKKISTYHGLDPVAWLKDFSPDQNVFKELGLNSNDDYVIIRPEEAQAAYLSGLVDEETSVTTPVIIRILEAFPELTVVVLCRYETQRKKMQARFGDRIIVPDKVIDAPTLLSSAILLVGAGGTMNQEASLMGIPVISCYPGNQLDTEKFLIKKQLLYRVTNGNQAADMASKILSHRHEFFESHQKNAKKLMNELENPADVISSKIIQFYKQKS